MVHVYVCIISIHAYYCTYICVHNYMCLYVYNTVGVDINNTYTPTYENDFTSSDQVPIHKLHTGIITTPYNIQENYTESTVTTAATYSMTKQRSQPSTSHQSSSSKSSTIITPINTATGNVCLTNSVILLTSYCHS